MMVEVVPPNDALLTLCRETAQEFPDSSWTLTTAASSSAETRADLCLYDYEPGLHISASAKWATRHFALVAPRDLERFRMEHPYAESAIILKPVTRAVIRALFAQSIALSERSSRKENDFRSDRNEILQCLIEANLRLQQYDHERTTFLERALHDFHAPLTALSGYCGLLAEQKLGELNDQQQLVIGRMHHSVHRLSRMTKAMFQLSIGRHVRPQPTLTEGNIRDCVDQALSEIQHLALEKDISIDVSLDLPQHALLIDGDQMEQVVVNLLENACKFSPRGGSIVVAGYQFFWDRRTTNVLPNNVSERRASEDRTSNAYRVDISDPGPGIRTEHLSTIFEEYVSYSGGNDRSRGGLGLAICRMILTQHQGRIWAENREAGAVFSFVLPLSGDTESHPAHPSSREVVHPNLPFA